MLAAKRMLTIHRSVRPPIRIWDIATPGMLRAALPLAVGVFVPIHPVTGSWNPGGLRTAHASPALPFNRSADSQAAHQPFLSPSLSFGVAGGREAGRA